jgi:hypothetical protein
MFRFFQASVLSCAYSSIRAWQLGLPGNATNAAKLPQILVSLATNLAKFTPKVKALAPEWHPRLYWAAQSDCNHRAAL